MGCEVCGAPVRARRDRVVRYCSPQCCGVAKRGVPLVAHPSFNRGLSFDRKEGRWRIMCRDGTQVLYSRGVMAAEIGRLLRSDEIVHHENERPDDDRPENLVITTRSAHIAMHRDAVLSEARVANLARGERHWTHSNPERVARGAAHGGSKLTDDDARAIRLSSLSHSALARRYGVSRREVRRIVRREVWAHV